MEPLNFRKDKEGNLRMSLSGLLYLIENGYLFDRALVHQVIDGEDNILIFFDDEEGVDLVREDCELDSDDEEILPSVFLDDNTIFATYYVSKEYYSFNKKKKQNNLIDYLLGDDMEEHENFLGKYISEDNNMEIDYYLINDDDLTDDEFDEIKMMLQEIIEESKDLDVLFNRKKFDVEEMLEYEKQFTIFEKKPTKKVIEKMFLEEYSSDENHSLDDILKEVKLILNK